jgi:hypothetical protein
MSTCTLTKLHIGTAARVSGGFAVALENGTSPITMLPQSQLAVKCLCKPLGQWPGVYFNFLGEFRSGSSGKALNGFLGK